MEKVEQIICKCGCEIKLNKYDLRGRKRNYIHGHNTNKKIENCKLYKGRNGYLYRNDMLEHRRIMEKYLGRKLNKNEHVHHKNKIRTDNRIKNLEVLSVSEHMSLHGKIKTWSIYNGDKCKRCGSSKKKHYANGLCASCYQMEKYYKNKLKINDR